MRNRRVITGYIERKGRGHMDHKTFPQTTTGLQEVITLIVSKLSRCSTILHILINKWINPLFSQSIGQSSLYKLILIIEKDVFRLVTSVRNRNSDLQILSTDALPLSHRDSVVSKAHYEAHIWHASCILLGSAISKASCFVNSKRW